MTHKWRTLSKNMFIAIESPVRDRMTEIFDEKDKHTLIQSKQVSYLMASLSPLLFFILWLSILLLLLQQIRPSSNIKKNKNILLLFLVCFRMNIYWSITITWQEPEQWGFPPASIHSFIWRTKILRHTLWLMGSPIWTSHCTKPEP